MHRLIVVIKKEAGTHIRRGQKMGLCASSLPMSSYECLVHCMILHINKQFCLTSIPTYVYAWHYGYPL